MVITTYNIVGIEGESCEPELVIEYSYNAFYMGHS